LHCSNKRTNERTKEKTNQLHHHKKRNALQQKTTKHHQQAHKESEKWSAANNKYSEMNFEGENGAASCGWMGGFGEGGGGMGIQQHPATNKGEKTEQQAADKRYCRREEEERLCKDEGHKITDLFCVRHSWPALSLSLSLFAAAPPGLAAATAAAILSKCVNSAKII
jgi:hypothetical protein